MRRIIFLGTGSGMPVASVCTSLLLEDDSTNLLLDTSGGHEILKAFRNAGKDPVDVQNIFISHWDSDHILGIVPLIRVFKADATKRPRTIYCSRDVKAAIEGIFSFTAHKHLEKAQEFVRFDIVGDGDTRTIGDWTVRFFDLASGKTPQLGCTVQFIDNKKLAFTGDEPLQEHCLPLVDGSDILLHEAFCTSDQIERFRPHEKHHGTAKDAGQSAILAHAKLLALFHMEDETLDTRKQAYEADAKASGFAGDIFVPIDGDRLEF
ncbi:MAG TPA: MBL fold metallo-hydrolase [Candidatus Saccharimonadales bacterium]